MPWARLIVAFLVAPTVGVLTAWLIAFCWLALPLGFALSLAPLAYGVTAVIGVPAFFLLRWWSHGLQALWWYAVAGFLVACFPAVPLIVSAVSPARALGVLVAIGGITAGLAFGLIWGRNLTIVGGVRERR